MNVPDPFGYVGRKSCPACDTDESMWGGEVFQMHAPGCPMLHISEEEARRLWLDAEETRR